jgi:hypothetical protein
MSCAGPLAVTVNTFDSTLWFSVESAHRMHDLRDCIVIFWWAWNHFGHQASESVPPPFDRGEIDHSNSTGRRRD